MASSRDRGGDDYVDSRANWNLRADPTSLGISMMHDQRASPHRIGEVKRLFRRQIGRRSDFIPHPVFSNASERKSPSAERCGAFSLRIFRQ